MSLQIVCWIGISQLLLLQLWLLREGGKSLAEKLFTAFVGAVICYLAAAVVENTLLAGLLFAFAVAIPGLLWLLCNAWFDDHYQLRGWQIALVATTVLAPFSYHWLLPKQDLLLMLLVQLPQGLEFVLLALAVRSIVRHWSADLVEQRRRMRLWLIAALAGTVLSTVLAMQLLDSDSWWRVQGNYLIAAILAFMLNLGFGRVSMGALFGDAQIEAPTIAPQPGESEEAVRLKALMEKGVYRETGLTIGTLAKKLDMQEYRLRRLINQQLGYRNFNDFLNGYRVQEAASRLRAEELPVLSIALDCGFRSISAFNQAFKRSFDMTPTAFREQ